MFHAASLEVVDVCVQPHEEGGGRLDVVHQLRREDGDVHVEETEGVQELTDALGNAGEGPTMGGGGRLKIGPENIQIRITPLFISSRPPCTPEIPTAEQYAPFQQHRGEQRQEVVQVERLDERPERCLPGRREAGQAAAGAGGERVAADAERYLTV